MIRKLKGLLISTAAALTFVMPLAVPVAVNAQNANSPITGQVCNVSQAGNVLKPIGDLSKDTTASCTGFTEQKDTLNDIITKIVNILSVIVGVVAVIMIVVGGFRYITSGGSSEKVTGAKNTILYALIGLIIVALAQVIVRFVLQKTATSST